MGVHRAYTRISIVLVLTSVMLFTTSVSGQSQSIKPNSAGKGVPAAQGLQLGNPENKVAVDEPKPKDLQSEVDAMKAENATVRELLRKMEEQQKTLLEQVDRLQRRLDEGTATNASIAGGPVVAPTTGDASAAVATNAASKTPPPE